MTRLALFIAVAAGCLIGMACSNATSGKSGAASADPFVGFFAHPSFGALELQPGDAEGKYRGSMWSDSGPLPVALTRDGSVARGTVSYGGANHPLQVENTAQGLIVTADGTRAEAPLQRYKDRQAYEKWSAAGGGPQGTIRETAPPSR